MKKKKEILEASDLRAFFYGELLKINQSQTTPLSQEFIYYASSVLDKFSKSDHFFENTDGKVREKILGLKLLETYNLDKEQQKSQLKDIGETALVVCGYFPPSQNKKIVNIEYYKNLGKTAFSQLNSIEPVYLDMQDFFSITSKIFDQVSDLINVFSNSVEKAGSGINRYIVGKKKAS